MAPSKKNVDLFYKHIQSHNSVEMNKLLKKCPSLIPFICTASPTEICGLSRSMEYDDLAMVKVFCDHAPEECKEKIASNLAIIVRHGSVEMMRYVCEKYNITPHVGIFGYSCRENISVAKYLCTIINPSDIEAKLTHFLCDILDDITLFITVCETLQYTKEDRQMLLSFGMKQTLDGVVQAVNEVGEKLDGVVAVLERNTETGGR